jgi:farnesyl-diphosphate farnesyltransferase
MPRWSTRDTTALSDEAYQDYILAGVSRTFALTIPQLPAALYRSVGNAYLLCRLADTIEDDPDLPAADKTALSERFIRVVAGELPADDFAREFTAALSPQTDAAEHDLVHNLPRVLRLTHGLSHGTQCALQRCVRIMATGMAHFQRNRSTDGLADMAELDRYCYHVAGVVGEMLTELYGEYSPSFTRRRAEMMPLAVSFGQGLQMTNILKDIWEDRARGACWLPRSVLHRHGLRDREFALPRGDARLGAALAELIGTAHGHLRNALRYTLLIPPHERGIRKFCLWALGMAILTLHRIHRHRDFCSAEEVKISRFAVRAVMALTSAASGHDRLLAALFRLATRGLPEPREPVTVCTEPLTREQQYVGSVSAGQAG